MDKSIFKPGDSFMLLPEVAHMTIKRRLFISNILMVVLPIILTYVMFFVIYSVFVGITGVDIFSLRDGAVPKPEDFPHRFDGHPRPYGMIIISLFVPLAFVFLINRILTKFIFSHIMTSINVLADGVREIKDGNLNYRIKHDMGNEFDAVCADFNAMAARLYDMVEQRQADEKNRKELIAGISHDLRTPLTSIKAYIEGVKKGVASTPQMQAKYFDTIQEKTEDMAYIINQLFLFSQIDIGEFPFNLETVDIGDELGKIVTGLTDEYMENGLEISLKENIQGEFVSIDIVQFRNIIQNILNNSVKYGNKDNNHAEIFCRRNNGHISVTVKDTGAGVPEENLAKIFEVFYRADASRNNPGYGSGLGLAIK